MVFCKTHIIAERSGFWFEASRSAHLQHLYIALATAVDSGNGSGRTGPGGTHMRS